MDMKDFALARAAAARNLASNVTALLDDFIAGLVDGDGTKKALMELVDIATDESGVLSRCLETIQHTLEQVDAEALKAGEPDYDDIIGDGASEEGGDEGAE